MNKADTVRYMPEEVQVVFSEVPDEITLAVNISGCENRCQGCHSPHLREDIGEILDEDALKVLIEKNPGITCVCFMGEGHSPERIRELSIYIKKNWDLKTAVYSGRTAVEKEMHDDFDYVKIGPYIADRGPLNSKTTNQRMLHRGEDITHKFWKN